MIKAIDTFYNGNYYRSRLEARWATFFDIVHIKYQYEPEGFVLGNGQRYLPDFYLPDFDRYVEIKAVSYKKEIDIMQHQDYSKWASFCQDEQLILLFGNPHFHRFLIMPFINPPDNICNWYQFYNCGDDPDSIYNWNYGGQVGWVLLNPVCEEEEITQLRSGMEEAMKKRFEFQK